MNTQQHSQRAESDLLANLSGEVCPVEDTAEKVCVSSREIAVRAGTRADAKFLAWAILSASRGHLRRGWFDISLGGQDCLKFLEALTLDQVCSLWHYSRFMIAEINGEVASTLCAYRALDAYAISPIAISHAIISTGLPESEVAQFWERGAYAFSCTVPPNDDCWILESIATLPQYRGSGCATRLLHEAIVEGQRRGLAEAQITTLIGNQSAERTYLKAGFRVANEWRSEAFEEVAGSPGLRRYARSLVLPA